MIFFFFFFRWVLLIRVGKMVNISFSFSHSQLLCLIVFCFVLLTVSSRRVQWWSWEMWAIGGLMKCSVLLRRNLSKRSLLSVKYLLYLDFQSDLTFFLVWIMCCVYIFISSNNNSPSTLRNLQCTVPVLYHFDVSFPTHCAFCREWKKTTVL